LLISALVIPGQPEHVRAAREFAALVLRAHSRDDDGTVGLLLSEMVTNSLNHSDSGKPGGTITVTVTVTPEKVVAEVADDGGAGEPVLGDPPGEEAERGRGLHLVNELSDDWGYFGGGQGQLATWFECALKAPDCIPGSAGRNLEDIPGSMAYPELKGNGDSSMPLKRRSFPGIRDGVPQGPRDMVKARLPEP
jgi:anti-sigma regulatory factor (Ser/Thr protein kinase)